MSVCPDYRAFGENLRALRKNKLRQTQEQFARYVLMDRSYISGLERGQRNPTLEIIVRLAQGLGVHPAELLRPLPQLPAMTAAESLG
ncbi:helix-turn-helix domain-containing protein [Arthrobacter psychrolactophilus]